MGVTAAIGDTLFEALSTVRSAVKTFKTDLTNAKNAHDAAVAVLRRKTSGSTVRVKIIAVNDDGDESPESEIVEIVVP